jgi:hypothetical protein
MALNPHVDDAGANAAADAVAALCNNGFIDIMSGSQPAANGAATTVLATVTFGATAFGAASGGVATANAIGNGTAGASGTATWFRAYKSDHTTPVFDGSVGTSGANMNLNSTAISSGATVSVSSLTFTITE